MFDLKCPFPLPLPKELIDDDQAAVLYSPFREKSLNPRSWIRKMDFWQNLILSTVSDRDLVAFDISNLASMFQRKGLSPKCLEMVVEELIRSGKLKRQEDYTKNEGWLSWGFQSLVRQPLSWGVSHILGSPKKGLAGAVLVCPSAVETMCQKVIDSYHSSSRHGVTDCITTLKDFRSFCESLLSNDQVFNFVLTRLQRTQKIHVQKVEEDILIKICKLGETSAEPFKETDIQMHRIAVTQKKLEQEVEVLSSRIDGHLEEARLHIRQKKKTLALHCLRKKKASQRILDRKSASIYKLEDIISKIEEAKSNEMVARACESGVASLKGLNATLGLDKVETVMDELHESLAEQADISTALAAGSGVEDVDGLEAELDMLLAGHQEIIGTEEEDDLSRNLASLSVDDLGLPDIPTHSPSHTSGQPSVHVASKSSNGTGLPS